MGKNCTCSLRTNDPWTPSHFDGGECPIHGITPAKRKQIQERNARVSARLSEGTQKRCGVNEIPTKPKPNIKPSPQSIKYCIWTENDDGIWEASCGKKDELLFEFNLDGPKANKFKYCPYCSKLIKEKEYKHG